MTDMSQYVWIEDAAREYHRSTSYLRGQIRAKALRPYRFPGDKRLYLARKELAAFFAPPSEQPE